MEKLYIYIQEKQIIQPNLNNKPALIKVIYYNIVSARTILIITTSFIKTRTKFKTSKKLDLTTHFK